mmetsp:Transcript_27692/g.54358  ORF Transcript_27692/g.54358 Transcript_27692/m.54358 type:complete len:86 (-) Transcript_27692:343-600(-)
MGWPLSNTKKSDDTTTRSVDRIFFASTIHFTEVAALDRFNFTPSLIDVAESSAVHLGANEGKGCEVANARLFCLCIMDISVGAIE